MTKEEKLEELRGSLLRTQAALLRLAEREEKLEELRGSLLRTQAALLRLAERVERLEGKVNDKRPAAA